jgi:hypothetical protein
MITNLLIFAVIFNQCLDGNLFYRLLRKLQEDDWTPNDRRKECTTATAIEEVTVPSVKNIIEGGG